jgi:hypothetical protein
MGLASDRERMGEVVGLFRRGSHEGIWGIDVEGVDALNHENDRDNGYKGIHVEEEDKEERDKLCTGPTAHGSVEDTWSVGSSQIQLPTRDRRAAWAG